jgi:beta-phosphoglucomutase-like phosphatase (HAD superfamily)
MGVNHGDEAKRSHSTTQRPISLDEATLPHIDRTLPANLQKQAERYLLKRAKHCPIVSGSLEAHLVQHPVINHLGRATDRFVIPSSIRAIALDFDGTTVDLQVSEGVRQKSWRLAIQAEGTRIRGSKLSREEIDFCHRPAMHKTEKEMSVIIADQLTRLTQSWVNPTQMWNDWIQAQQQVISRMRRGLESSIVRGVLPLLREATSRGLQAVSVTMGAQQLVQPMLQRSGVDTYLNPVGHVFINMHPKIEGKPHPDPYLLACQKLGIQPHELLVLEDSSTGALSGFRAGATVLLQPSVNRAKTLVEIRHALRHENPATLANRDGAITLLSRQQGWAQVGFS